MSYPQFIKETEATDLGWRRRARDTVNALVQRTSGQGTTSERPRSPLTGMQYYDTTLGLPIWYSGTAWINATGAVV